MNKKQFFIIMILLIPFLVKGQRHSVFIQGDIRFSDSSLSVQEAGLNVTSSIHSEKTVLVSVEYTGSPENNPNYNWRVYVHMQAIEWDDSFRLEIKRTGSGRNKNNAGNPNINDGQVFQELTHTPTLFFRGKGEIVDIPLALTISGYSVTMGGGEFESGLVFTVYDN